MEAIILNLSHKKTSNPDMETPSIISLCLKCKVNQPIVECKTVKTQNNRTRLTGKCNVCNAKISKFIKNVPVVVTPRNSEEEEDEHSGEDKLQHPTDIHDGSDDDQ